MAQQDILPTDAGDTSLTKIEANFTELYTAKDNLEVVVNNASASAPASLDLHEDTDNGTNKITITAPSTVASDKTITLPDATGTAALTSDIPVKATGAEITTGTDDAKFLTSKALADATVGKLGAAWTSFNPSWTNLTVGAGGTSTGAYCQIGKTIHYRIYFKFGTGSSVGAVSVALPITAASGYVDNAHLGNVVVTDAGSGTFYGHHMKSGYIGLINTASTYAGDSVLSSSVPMTWTTNDELIIVGTYEAA